MDEVGGLGFSATDVTEVLTGLGSVDTIDDRTGSASTRDLTWTFTATGAMDEVFGDDPTCEAHGPALQVDGTVDVVSADGWVQGSGPVTLIAQGTDPDAISPSAYFDVTPSIELQDRADEIGATVPGCAADAAQVKYDLGAGPWSAGPGSIDFETCDANRVLFRLEWPD